jgi:hypothetical protein
VSDGPPRQPVRVGPRGTLYLVIERAHRTAAWRWVGRVLIGAIGAALFQLARHVGGF